MSSKTIYACDRCKAEFAEYGHTRSIAVTHNDNFREPPNRGVIEVPVRVDWCFECCKAVGILRPFWSENAIPDVAPAPTIEELIQEMIRGMVRVEVAAHVER